MKKRIRKTGSIKNELISKSKESMLTAIQIFNNPSVQFKSESFIVLAVIAWTYLLLAYYRSKKIECRQHKKKGQRRKFYTTKHKAYKYWGLEECLDNDQSPIDEITVKNLKFLIGLRHEIEHQMTTRIDNFLSAKFQACCLNYNNYLKKLFPKQESIEKQLSFSLQFSSFSEKQVVQLMHDKGLPQNISSYIETFEHDLPDSDFNDSRFSYRVLFVQRTVNRKGQADQVIEFIPADSKLAKGLNTDYCLIKESEKKKYLPSDIWKKMQKEGFEKFKSHQHTTLWKTNNAKNSAKGFGVQVAKTWYWYELWMQFVRKHCEENAQKYR